MVVVRPLQTSTGLLPPEELPRVEGAEGAEGALRGQRQERLATSPAGEKAGENTVIRGGEGGGKRQQQGRGQHLPFLRAILPAIFLARDIVVLAHLVASPTIISGHPTETDLAFSNSHLCQPQTSMGFGLIGISICHIIYRLKRPFYKGDCESMRLSRQEIEGICGAFEEFAVPGCRLYLYGSRADDTLKGGDIDLHFEVPKLKIEEAKDNYLDFLVNIKGNIGEQKIDLYISSPDIDDDVFLNQIRQQQVLLKRW